MSPGSGAIGIRGSTAALATQARDVLFVVWTVILAVVARPCAMRRSRLVPGSPRVAGPVGRPFGQPSHAAFGSTFQPTRAYLSTFRVEM